MTFMRIIDPSVFIPDSFWNIEGIEYALSDVKFLSFTYLLEIDGIGFWTLRNHYNS